MPDTPEIVCICGSTRFAEQMRVANRDLTLAGAIVVAPGVFAHQGDHITDEQKTALDALHLHKIDLADRVLVVNPGGYIGESTRREIAYAHRARKPVEYTDPILAGPLGGRPAVVTPVGPAPALLSDSGRFFAEASVTSTEEAP